VSNLASPFISAFLDRFKRRGEAKEGARVAARTLAPEIERLLIDVNDALRTNRPGRLGRERVVFEAWTPDEKDAIARAVTKQEWEHIEHGIDLIGRTLEDGFFPALPDDGTVGRDAALGLLGCGFWCIHVLYLLDMLALDPAWAGQKKLDAVHEVWDEYGERLRQLQAQIHPSYEAYLRDRAGELEGAAQPATAPATAPPSSEP
jgi:hypothetical protein